VPPRNGAINRAERGVLFDDEACAFRKPRPLVAYPQPPSTSDHMLATRNNVLAARLQLRALTARHGITRPR
jgi:hypothetical protein